jgi:hypothetical protein
MWSQSRDPTSRTNNSCSASHRTRTTSTLPINFKIILKWTAGTLSHPLSSLEQAIFPRGRARHQKWLVVHLDNCSFHMSTASASWSKEQDMLRMPHPSYSSDLAPSDFYLFLTVKQNVQTFSWLRKTSSLISCKNFWRVSIKRNWIGYFALRRNGFKK